MARADSKKVRLATYLTDRKVDFVDEAVFLELQRELAPVSEAYLRKLLKESGCKLAPLIEGVRMDALANTERSLIQLGRTYIESDGAMRARIRKLAIEAKDRLRWTLNRPALDSEKRSAREEMLLWTLTWLENPSLFESWIALRKRSQCISQ